MNSSVVYVVGGFIAIVQLAGLYFTSFAYVRARRATPHTARALSALIRSRESWVLVYPSPHGTWHTSHKSVLCATIWHHMA